MAPTAFRRPARVVLAIVLGASLVGTIGLGTAFGASVRDTDRDGLPDTFETYQSKTSPTRVDTDRDGIRDGKEDLDRDGLQNHAEYVARTSPRMADTDRDGIRDPDEDFDRDGLRTIIEFRAKTNPRIADSDHDGRSDAIEDGDRDGYTNIDEQAAGTHPGLASSHPAGAGGGGGGTGGGGGAGGAPTLPGAPDCPIFPATNVWNVPVDSLPVAGNSATLVNAIGAGTGLHMDFGSYAGYGIPYNIVGASTARSTVTFEYDGESDHVGYPIPASPKVEGGSDRHILLVDKDACRLYELFAAQLASGHWQAGSGATWDLTSNALRTDGWTSADAAGLPILPGLVRYDEVAAGTIRHALRFTVPHTRTSYIYPARHEAGESSSAALPPMGLRIRLKASYPIAGFSPQARVILQALKTYGMILADNGSAIYISGASDPRFDDDVMHEMDGVTGSDFEVVDTSSLRSGTQ